MGAVVATVGPFGNAIRVHAFRRPVLRKTAVGMALLWASMTSSTARAQASIEGTVLDSLRSRSPMAGAMVVLVEQNRYARSDARGRFRFDNVPTGRVSLGFLHPLLDSLDLQLPPLSLETTNGQVTKTALVVPPALRLYSQLCSDVRDPDGGVVVGRVRDVDDGTPIADAVVATQWIEFTLVEGRSTPKVMATAARTNASGIFVLCNVPIDVPLAVRARRDGVLAGPAQLSLDDRLVGHTELALSRRDTAARYMVVSDSVVADHVVRGTATLRGRVVRPNGTPVSDATIGVPGSGRLTRTDVDGRFTLDGVAAGTRSVDVRAVGGAPLLQVFDFASDGVRDTTFVLLPPPQTLHTVTTTAPRTYRGSGFEASGFFERQRMGFGAFATEEEIKRHESLDLNALLLRMRGVSVEADMMRGLPGMMPYLRGMRGGRCIPAFFLDGVRIMVDSPSPDPKGNAKYPYTDFVGMVPVQSIKAIEVYPNPGGIPLQFDDTALGGCGSIVIWTR